MKFVTKSKIKEKEKEKKRNINNDLANLPSHDRSRVLTIRGIVVDLLASIS